MAFDHASEGPQTIAIIGGGISGLAAAWLLSDRHRVTVFEAEPRFGGHARTVRAGKTGAQPVDTGFIVFNHVNYPHLTRLFNTLDVPVERSNMSFAVSIGNGEIEYGLQGLGGLFAQKGNLARPAFLRMVRDLLRFKAAVEDCEIDEAETIEEMSDRLGFGTWFRDVYLRPMCGAIWSTPNRDIGRFPAAAMVRFFRNHGLLSKADNIDWWTVSGGSVEYVRRLCESLLQTGVSLRHGTPVAKVTRSPYGVTVTPSGQVPEQFNHVIFACHSDQALGMLGDVDDAEASALSAIRYQPNRMVLHADPSQMPRRRAAWASWVYRAPRVDAGGEVGVTYWMNRLQNIPEDDPLFVTLNPVDEISPDLIYDQKTFHHPLFDGPALEAQQRLAQMQGRNRTWFAGAYLRNGFHEDGFASAARIARAMTRGHV